MRIWSRAAAVSALFGLGSLSAAEVTLPCTADTSICCHPTEVTHNLGAAPRIKAKGIENFLLLDFDTGPIRGRRVSAAALYLTSAIPNPMFRKVGVSTVSTPWAEGSRESQEPARDGECTFLSPEQGRRDWAGPGSDFTYASFGNGGTFWRRVYVTPPDGGVFAIPLDPRLVEALAAGLSCGLAVSDDNGEVMYVARDVCPDTCFDNNFFHSREAPGRGPRLVVTLAPEDEPAARPAPVRGLRVTPCPPAAGPGAGAVRVSWSGGGEEGPSAVLGYAVRAAVGSGPAEDVPRWRIPLPPAAGGEASMVLDGLPPGQTVRVEVVAVGRAGLRSEPAAAAGPASPALALPLPLTLAADQEGEGAEPPARNGVLRVWAFPDLLKTNPVTGNLLEEPGVAYDGPPAGNSRRANTAWDGSRQRILLRGARGEWVAFQLAIEIAGPPDARLEEVRVTLPPELRTADGATAAHLHHAGISRAWYIRSGDAWYADPLVPVQGSFSIPWAENAVPGQRNQTIYLEFFIGKETQPGAYEGAVLIAARGVPEFRLPLALEVFPFTVPEETHFVWSMNAYSSPGRYWGSPGEARYLAAERAFYVQSHVHRTCLAVLHYSHRGTVGDDAAPPLTGKGRALRVADWSRFDERFGPLFDGSAFAGTPRAGVPLEHFYLTFHENWPVSMAEGYAWNGVPFEEHWRVCGPVEEGFSAEYQAAWKALLSDFAAHFRERGWTRTRFQVYLNNKFLYKRYDEKTGQRGSGVSFWLFDEPAYADDFLALAFFGRLVRGALGPRPDPVVFRADISRPQFQRDTLDGLLDLNVCGNYAAYRRLVDDRRRRFGETLWTYGSLCRIEDSATELSLRAVWLHAQTVEGFVPWLTLGGPQAWTEATETIAFYPGGPVGVEGPVPSLRLKACRRGEQDVEYVWLTAQRRGLDRRQTGALILAALAPATETRALDAHGARFETPRVPHRRLEALRAALAGELSRVP